VAGDPNEFEPFLDVNDVAKMLRFSGQHIRRLAEQKIIPAKKYGKEWRFLRSDLFRGHKEMSGIRITEVPSVSVEQPTPAPRRPRGRPARP
jgi:excisionase family DNA binding protein